MNTGFSMANNSMKKMKEWIEFSQNHEESSADQSQGSGG
jgi:hypothetical protein